MNADKAFVFNRRSSALLSGQPFLDPSSAACLDGVMSRPGSVPMSSRVAWLSRSTCRRQQRFWMKLPTNSPEDPERIMLRVLLLASVLIAGARGQNRQVVIVSAASFAGNAPVAPASIASAFGQGLATATAAAETLSLHQVYRPMMTCR